MKIAIFGGRGLVGRPTVEQALAAGHEVTMLARDASKVDLTDPKLTVIEGDALDPDAVQRTIAGSDAVINSIGVPRSELPNDTISRATRIIIDTMEQSGPQRLVCMSMMGIGEGQAQSGLFGKLIMPMLKKKLADRYVQEDMVKASSLEWVLVRPARITDGPPTGKVKGSPEQKGGLTSKVSNGDVAAFVLSQTGPGAFVGHGANVVS